MLEVLHHSGNMLFILQRGNRHTQGNSQDLQTGLHDGLLLPRTDDEHEHAKGK